MPDTPVLEIIMRGSVMYLALFFLLRLILKRESGGLGITDVLVVVLIADAAQNGMADDYSSIADGLILVATIVFWTHFLNWLGYKSPFLQRILKPSKLLLVKNGRMIRKNMAEELITEEELMTEVRTNGVNDLKDVEEAYMESNGRISIISKTKTTSKVV